MLASNSLEITSLNMDGRGLNWPNLTKIRLETLLKVKPFNLAHILKAHKISVHMRYHMCPLYNSKKYTKLECILFCAAPCKSALTYQVLKLHFLRFPTLVSFTSVNQLLWQDTMHIAHKSFPKVGVPIPNEDSSTKIQININFYFINWWLKGMLIQG